jgi:predicted nuclease of predicted toxin-antitoxin system
LIRLLADENVPRASVERLREAEIDVVQARPGSSDREVLAEAAGAARAIVTFDLDFGGLVLEPGAPQPLGVVLLRDIPVDPEAPSRVLLRLLARRDLELAHRLTVVRAGRVRQRALPRGR